MKASIRRATHASVVLLTVAAGAVCSRAPMSPVTDAARSDASGSHSAEPRSSSTAHDNIGGPALPAEANLVTGLIPSDGFRLATPQGGSPPMQLTAAERATIDYAGLPGPDGRTLTSDDIPYGPADFYNTGGSRLIKDEYAVIGVHAAGAGMVELIGGGLNPDGTPSGTNVVIIDINHSCCVPIAPMTLTFDLDQTDVTFDLFAQVNVLGTALPIVLRNAGGAVVSQFQLTNANAIIGGDLFFLAGRYRVTSATAFRSMEVGLTVEGGGWFFDNLNFE